MWEINICRSSHSAGGIIVLAAQTHKTQVAYIEVLLSKQTQFYVFHIFKWVSTLTTLWQYCLIDEKSGVQTVIFPRWCRSLDPVTSEADLPQEAHGTMPGKQQHCAKWGCLRTESLCSSLSRGAQTGFGWGSGCHSRQALCTLCVLPVLLVLPHMLENFWKPFLPLATEPSLSWPGLASMDHPDLGFLLTFRFWLFSPFYLQ
jgi:hypothetical protein